MTSSPTPDDGSRTSQLLRTPTRRRAGVVSLIVPPQLAPPPRSPLPDIPRPSSTGPTGDRSSDAESWIDGPGTAPGVRLTMPESQLGATTKSAFRNVPKDCGGTYSSDTAGLAPRRIGAVDLQDSIGVFFSLGVKRCFCARITARVLPLSGPPEHFAEGIMAAKIRHEVAARLDEEAQRSRWPEANAHMRETALFVCSGAGEKDWERSTLHAVAQGVQDWLGWKSKFKGALLRFGGTARPGVSARDGFVISQKVVGEVFTKQLESPQDMTGVDDTGSGQLWEVTVVKSVRECQAVSHI